MNCPHCQGRLPVRRPVTNPRHYRLTGHHGEMELDAGQLKAMAACALAYATQGHEIVERLQTIKLYSEVMERMEHDPAFAHHVLSYDGDGGKRFFPGATKAAKLAAFKNRIANSGAREDDLLRYIELMTSG